MATVLLALVWLASIPIVVVLLLFTVRRIVFTGAMFLASEQPPRAAPSGSASLPNVLVLVPCREEASMISSLARALEQLEYPRESLQVVLIDDGSSDDTGACMARVVEARPDWHSLLLPRNVGKASALNAALARFSFGEIIYVFDADHRPAAETLRRAVRYFDDPRVGGVTGFTRVCNPIASASTYYSTVESYANQLVTMRGKDRLNLAPALLGSNCGYRRTALVECGGFRAGALSEDSDMTIRLYRAGYRVRFGDDAISHQQVPQTVRGYLRQHARWGRGLNDVARSHSAALLSDGTLAVPLRLELLLFTAGYLDRIAVVAGVALSAFSLLSQAYFWFLYAVVFASLFVPFLQIVALFAKERMPRAMWIRLPLIPMFFALDVLAAAQAWWATLFDRSRLWTKTERVPVPPYDVDRRLRG